MSQPETTGPPSRLKIAYLVSQYPAVNHTFILREIRSLRGAGWDLQTVSVRDCDRTPSQLTTDERDEQSRTLYVKSAGPSTVLRSHVKALGSAPGRYCSAVALALRLGHSTPKQLLLNLAYFSQAVTAGAWLMSRGYAHVHSHFSSTVALLISQMYPIQFSVTMHGPDEFTDPKGFSLTAKADRAQLLVAISSYARSQLMRFSSHSNWTKYVVCRLGISPEVFHPVKRMVADDSVRLVCVARLSPVKGHHILLQALELVLRQYQLPVVLHIVGDGPERHSLENQVSSLGIAGSVVFEGWLNQDQVADVYRRSDIFVLPSFAEGVPVVLMEAMAMEIPCIATYVNGVPELIDHGENGLLIPPSDPVSLAGAIMKLVQDPDLRAKLGSAGRRKVILDFDLQRNTEQLSRIFEENLTIGIPAKREPELTAKSGTAVLPDENGT